MYSLWVHRPKFIVPEKYGIDTTKIAALSESDLINIDVEAAYPINDLSIISNENTVSQECADFQESSASQEINNTSQKIINALHTMFSHPTPDRAFIQIDLPLVINIEVIWFEKNSLLLIIIKHSSLSS